MEWLISIGVIVGVIVGICLIIMLIDKVAAFFGLDIFDIIITALLILQLSSIVFAVHSVLF